MQCFVRFVYQDLCYRQKRFSKISVTFAFRTDYVLSKLLGTFQHWIICFPKTQVKAIQGCFECIDAEKHVAIILQITISFSFIENFCILIQILLKFIQGSSQQKMSIGLGNCLVSSRQRAITWPNDGTVHWGVCASRSLNQLRFLDSVQLSTCTIMAI